MLKAAKVNLARYEYLGGNRVACCIRGNVTAVGIAVETGLATARQFGEARAAVLANPNPVLSRFLEFPETIEMIFSCHPSQDIDYGSKAAIGLIEARGFVPLVAALDEMLKAAEITINGCASTEDQIAVILCGGLAAVEQALDIGTKTVRQVGGEIVATAIIPRPEIQTRVMTTAPNPPASTAYCMNYASPILALKSGSTARRHKKLRRS
jgi:ethanolamine utilization protein EutM